MILHIELKDPRSTETAFFDVWDVSAGQVAHLRQCHGEQAVQKFCHDLIVAKLPTHLYNYEVVDWSFRDHVMSEVA